MQGDRIWEARGWATKAIRLSASIAPLLCAAAISVFATRQLPAATGLTETLIRTLLICLLSIATLRAVDAVARRFLPLATLMQLSIIFPDQAPSRFKLALRSGSGRRVAQVVEHTRRHGLDDDPAKAAEQVVVLATALNNHDRRTRGHSERVRLYADMIGEEMGLKRDERLKLQWAALLHDIGKLNTPPAILNKPGKLTPKEWAIMQRHAARGGELVKPLAGFLGEWVHGIAGHHEKWDGTGYPLGLKGPQIPRAAAIVALADSFEVMTAVRSYKKALSLKEARLEVTRCAGSHFAPDVVRAFLSISIGRVRTTMGPVAALAHLPFVSTLAQAPSAVASAVTISSAPIASVAMPVLIATGTVAMDHPEPAVAIQPVAVQEFVAATDARGASAPFGSVATSRVGQGVATPNSSAPPRDAQNTTITLTTSSTTSSSSTNSTATTTTTKSSTTTTTTAPSTTRSSTTTLTTDGNNQGATTTTLGGSNGGNTGGETLGGDGTDGGTTGETLGSGTGSGTSGSGGTGSGTSGSGTSGSGGTGSGTSGSSKGNGNGNGSAGSNGNSGGRSGSAAR